MKSDNYNGIIFLDVDGVLNHRDFFIGREKRLHEDIELWRAKMLRELCPKSIKILNRILTTCNLGIVLSSTWRKADFCREALFNCGIDSYKERLLGYTPRLSYVKGETRGREIQAWLDENQYVGKIAILDDDADFGKLLPYLFQTNAQIDGLNEEIANRVIQYFQA